MDRKQLREHTWCLWCDVCMHDMALRESLAAGAVLLLTGIRLICIMSCWPCNAIDCLMPTQTRHAQGDNCCAAFLCQCHAKGHLQQRFASARSGRLALPQLSWQLGADRQHQRPCACPTGMSRKAWLCPALTCRGPSAASWSRFHCLQTSPTPSTSHHRGSTACAAGILPPRLADDWVTQQWLTLQRRTRSCQQEPVPRSILPCSLTEDMIVWPLAML